MTTKGLGGWSHGGGILDALRELPRDIRKLEASGHPVIVEWPAGIELAVETQRLYSTLGVLVRFVESKRVERPT